VPGLESWDGTAYARVLRLPGGPGTARLTAVDGGFDVEIALTDPADRPVALAQLNHLLDLDGNPAAAREHLAADSLLAPLVSARPGLRTPGSVDHVETLLRTIIGQQISVAGAGAVMGRVVAAHGDPLPPALATQTLRHSFPTVATLAKADPVDLPMPRARGRSVVAVAQAVLDRGEELAGGQPEQATDLLALPGIGPWTAAYLALRAARDPDVFLPTDLAVRRAFEGHGLHGLAGDPRAVAARSIAWSPHRSLALMHLWTHLLENRAGGWSRLSASPGRLGPCRARP
jgi:AraC family transcriptional regulator of adaptative response / DNA-3-methyladenine glycosylase II